MCHKSLIFCFSTSDEKESTGGPTKTMKSEQGNLKDIKSNVLIGVSKTFTAYILN